MTDTHLLTLVFHENPTPAEQILLMASSRNAGWQLSWNDEKTAATLTLDGPYTLEELKTNPTLQFLQKLPTHDRILQTTTEQGIKIAFFDMDSTLIQNECIDEMARQCDIKNGITSGAPDSINPNSCFDKVWQITHGAMNDPSVSKTFEETLKERIDIIIQAGFHKEDLPACFERIRPTSGAKELLQHLQHNGVKTVLVSGGFSDFVEHVINHHQLPINEYYCNTLVFNPEGKLAEAIGSDKLEGRIIGKEAKRDIIKKEVAEYNHIHLEAPITTANTMMTGDGGNDEFAVKKAGIGIAFKASNKKLLQAATGHVTSDLHALTHIPLQRQQELSIPGFLSL